MGILIDNIQNRIEITLKTISKTAQAILNALDKPDAELSILIVDDKIITELNREYLNRDKPTNVIAFPMQEGEFSEISPELLGDVVISVDTAEKEGKEAGITLEERFNQLLVHGILHLLGYDDKTEEEELVMEAKSEELLVKITEETELIKRKDDLLLNRVNYLTRDETFRDIS